MSNETIEKNNKFKLILEKIKEKSKLIIITLSILVLVFLTIIFLNEKAKNQNILTSEQFNKAKILIGNEKKEEANIILKKIINKENKFYSPLSLYLIIENQLESDPQEVVKLFDKLILNKKIDEDNKNLIRIKKAFFIANFAEEQSLLEVLNPVINSNSVWKIEAIKFLVDYFSNKGEKKKSDEYYNLLIREADLEQIKAQD
tara:strand:+ start:3544 stop:4149 length:606 start_codon:yes stop_codon:yes gene_type:complete